MRGQISEGKTFIFGVGHLNTLGVTGEGGFLGCKRITAPRSCGEDEGLLNFFPSGVKALLNPVYRFVFLAICFCSPTLLVLVLVIAAIRGGAYHFSPELKLVILDK